MTVKRRSPKNRIIIDYLGNFSETDDTTTADNQRATASWNRFLSDRFLHHTGVRRVLPRPVPEHRLPMDDWGWGSVTSSSTPQRSNGRVDAGIAYQDDIVRQTCRKRDPQSNDSPALAIGTDYENKFAGWIKYLLDYSFFIVNEESGSYTHHLSTGFEIDLWGDFDFDITWVWDRIQNPQEMAGGIDPVQDDFRMIFALGYKF